MKKVIFVAVILALACVMLSGCESWSRGMKSIASDFTGGLHRTVSVYSYDGDLIQSWSGKFDVSDSENEVYFDLNGKRIIIQGGIVINEEQ